jgi:hypothetical protein
LGYRIRRGVVRRYWVVARELRLFPGAVSCVGSKSWIARSFHQMLWPVPRLGSFDIAFTRECRFVFGSRSTFLSTMTQGYPDFSRLYFSMTPILVLLSSVWVLLLELCFILASSSRDIGAILSISDFLSLPLFRSCPLFRTLL